MIRSIRVYITEQCNANCPTCFNKQNRSNVNMPFNKFCDICDLFSTNGVQHIKIMGGEPTIHTDFSRMVEYAQQKFQYVHIFTNSINDNITEFSYEQNSDYLKEKIINETEKEIKELIKNRLDEKNISYNGISLHILEQNGNLIVKEINIDCTENNKKDIYNCIEDIISKESEIKIGE